LDWTAVVGWGLGVACAAGAVVAAAVAVLPVRVEARGELRELAVRGRFEASLGLGLVALRREWDGGVALRVLGAPVWRWSAGSGGAAGWLWRRVRDPAARGPWARRARRAVAVAGAAFDHWRPLGAEARRLWRAVRYRVEVSGTVGLEDPADTVVLFEVLRHVLPRGPRVEVTLCRDYFDETLELDARLRARAWPPRLAAVCARALLRKVVRRALGDLRRAGRAAGGKPNGGDGGTMEFVKDIMADLNRNLAKLAEDNAVVGRAVSVGDRHAVTLCEITIAFGGGAGSGQGSVEERIKPSGMRGQGAGGAAKTRPVAVLVIDGDKVRLEPLPD
jgi:uncharacterized spore protein YtfJ